ncbi:Rha family transcriptional regulator [Alicyclobacillus sp. ALC3]|uniref:Rha family transcriptional regulator n=1 Tax=Alicyclobacillus sp. ALC3 TaxID=2796143 RepID=UPI002379E159|nr:phage antirepressor KilAC domain-containing protein [Alicyclobacillus sp. ALC3]WDL97840.1 phage antirepressor KilAC domain-containing protein [Alicyclobacillus sp. ALC3]
MNELVFIQNDRPVTDSLTVATVFGKRHDNVVRDIAGILAEVDGEWGVLNFEETHYTNPQNGQEYRKYVLTEDGFTILAMGYTGHEAMQFKVRYIQEFRRMESELKSRSLIEQFSLPRNYPEALRALAESSERNEAMQKQLEEQAPKVALYDVAMSADNAQPIGSVAKELGIGPNKLFAFLRDHKVLMSSGARYNQPYQEYMDRGCFRVRQYTITHFTTGIENKTQTLVTPKGVAFIHQLLEKQAQPV